MILTQILFGKVDLTMVLNGALAGLVSITAEPLAPTMIESLLIGAVGGVIVVFTVPLLDRLRVDDVVGAIPVHLFAGIWGTIAVAFNTQTEISEGVTRSMSEQVMIQLYGIGLVGLFTFGASFGRNRHRSLSRVRKRVAVPLTLFRERCRSVLTLLAPAARLQSLSHPASSYRIQTPLTYYSCALIDKSAHILANMGVGRRT